MFYLTVSVSKQLFLLFNVLIFNSCIPFLRERQALVTENYARYHAMKTRWKELITAYECDVKPGVPETSPLYLRECQSFNGETHQDYQQSVGLSGTAVETLGKDQIVFLNLTAKVCSKFYLHW